MKAATYAHGLRSDPPSSHPSRRASRHAEPLLSTLGNLTIQRVTAGSYTPFPLAYLGPASAGAVGNQGVGLLMQRACASGGTCPRCEGEEKVSVQLAVSNPGDLHEREADRIAGEIASRPAGQQPPVVHGLKTPASATSGASMVAGGASQPLPFSARSELEPRLGHDLGAVRVHADAEAAEAANRVQARAFTLRQDIYFAAGQYAPDSADGRRLLAHELVHTIQQRDGAALVQRACPAPPTGVGATPSSEPCETGTAEAVSGSILYFCTDSTELVDEESRDGLARLLVRADEATRIAVHGYASADGPNEAYDRNLSCLRAVAVANQFERSGAAVPVKKIAHGRTTGYGPREPKLNRAVVVQIDAPAAAPPSKKQAFLDLEKLLDQELTQIQGNIGSISNKSLIFTDAIAHAHRQVAVVRAILTEGHRLIEEADKLTGAAADKKFDEASARYEAVMLGAPVVHWQMAYFIVASAAEDARVPSREYVKLLFVFDTEMVPLVEGFLSLDRAKIASAAALAPAKFRLLRDTLEKFVADVKVGAAVSAKVIAALDAALIVYSIYQAGRAIGAARGGPPATFQVPVIGGVTGGAATLVTVSIPAEVLEAIRQLIAIGAISASVVNLGVPGVGVSPTGPTLVFRATPSGSVTPSTGPDAGKSTSYGDSRHKHTKLADHTMDEMKDAIKSPSSAKPPLDELPKRIGDKAWGSQLSKEAVDKYADLVKDALESGTRIGKTVIEHKALFEVGIDIATGKSTTVFRMHFSPAYGGWHMFPVF